MNINNICRFLLIILTELLVSCSNRDTENPGDILEFEINLTANQIFQFELGGMAVEGGYSISNPGNHFSVCEIKFSPEDKLIFEYQPENGYAGTDFVEIRNCVSAGGPDCVQVVLYRFYFKIE
jgi:hypothetical protein